MDETLRKVKEIQNDVDFKLLTGYMHFVLDNNDND